MKKSVLTFVVSLLLAATGLAQSDTDKGMTRVSKMQGVEVYAMCEPVREYSVLFSMNTGVKAGSVITGGLVNEGVSDKLSQFVKRVMKEAEKKGEQVDAIVYSGGKDVAAIKFKAESTAQNKGLAKAAKLSGYEVYVMNEPLRDYETVVDVSTGAKAKSYITGGLVNNSVEEDISQYVKRAEKEAKEENKKIDAVVYSGGKRAIGVKFK